MDQLGDFGLSLRDEGPAPPAPAELYARFNTSLSDVASLSQLVLTTPQPRLAEALRTQEHITQRKLLIQDAVEGITPKAVLALTHAAGVAYNQPVSAPLNSLLTKLAREAETLPEPERVHADQSFRSLAREIVEAWSADTLDLGASDFQSLFETEYDPLRSKAGSAAPEPQRVLQMAFETGALGKTVWTAVTALGEQAGTAAMLEMLKRVPSGNRAADAVGHQLANPMRVTLLLQADPVDFALLDALLPRMGDAAPGVLLENIIESRNSDVRRGLLERMSQFGEQVIPLVVERLKRDERWYVQRNMLAILRDLKAPISLITIEKYLTHSDHRVRREAMLLQFQDPAQRARALVVALKENEYPTLKLALQAARQGCPEVAVPVLAKRVVDPQFPADFRPVALQLLARTRSAFALDALLHFVAAGTTLLGKPKLAAKSPEMLIALSGLARNFAADARVAPLLATAAESKDRDIAGAASRGSTSEQAS
jgi:hypothetical protein